MRILWPFHFPLAPQNLLQYVDFREIAGFLFDWYRSQSPIYGCKYCLVRGRAGAVSKLRDMASGEVRVGIAGSSHEKCPAMKSRARRLGAWQPLVYLRSSISEFSLNLFPHSYPQIKRIKKKKAIHHSALKAASLQISECSRSSVLSLLLMSLWLWLQVLFRINNALYKRNSKTLPIFGMSNQNKTDRTERMIRRKLEGHNYRWRSHFSKISQHIHDTGQGIASAEVHSPILNDSVGSELEQRY